MEVISFINSCASFLAPLRARRRRDEEDPVAVRDEPVGVAGEAALREGHVRQEPLLLVDDADDHGVLEGVATVSHLFFPISKA